ncbi:hypothetical protein L9F63_014620 [Diploptera punctata]|uniref:Uncharacterized protein n=1 Tax=Diploptera punctata TaxID=6984 RepID=A0AAD8A7P1_DIPPU|nr:hypothetical protein L9F63_014620 [Diploptera punctata]
MSANRRERIAIEKLREVVNEMLRVSDCSELSSKEDSNDEIIYSDNVTVRATDGKNTRYKVEEMEGNMFGKIVFQQLVKGLMRGSVVAVFGVAGEYLGKRVGAILGCAVGSVAAGYLFSVETPTRFKKNDDEHVPAVESAPSLIVCKVKRS